MNVAGNHYDKYGTRNPIARRLMAGFLGAFDDLIKQTGATAAFEVGCGEGELALRLARRGIDVEGCDIDTDIVAVANANATAAGFDPTFRVADVQNLNAAGIAPAELIVCCEVLEHVDAPTEALDVLADLGARHLLLSVPREPIWRALNMARGKYLSAAGNTPGHINHWGQRAFREFVARRLDVVAVRSPLPWTMLLCQSR